MPIFNIRDGGPRYSGYIWPPYPIYLKRNGKVIPLTNVDPAVIQVVFKHIQSGDERIGTGSCELPDETAEAGETAEDGKAFYRFSLEDLGTPGRYHVCVSLQLPSDPAPMACDMVSLEIRAYPAYAGGSTPPPTSDIPTAMPLVSVGLSPYTNDDCFTAYGANLANNTNYADMWRACQISPSVDTPVWLAYDISTLTSQQKAKILLAWYNDPQSGFYDHSIVSQNAYNLVRDYTIDAHAGAGGGQPPSANDDGWSNLATVTNNHYHSRQHVISLTGYNWIRLKATASDSTSGTDIALNMDLHQVTTSAPEDDILLIGDSITMNGAIHDNTGGGTLSQLINAQLNSHFPVIEAAGTGGYSALDVSQHIAAWLAIFPGKYVALAIGTNDANGGGSLVSNFQSNMTAIINAIIGAGKIPIVANIPWGRPASVQTNGPTLNTQIQQLYTSFPQIIHGPDLWSYFNAHQDLIEALDLGNGLAGIHPVLPDGYAAWRTLWRDALLTNLYQVS